MARHHGQTNFHIIDNRGDNTVASAPRRLLPNLQKMDVATGVFEVGSFLLLEELWRSLDHVRILMGDETTRRTKREIIQSISQVLDASIEREKERDDTLDGLPAVREAIAKAQIGVRVYSKTKFHGKCYLMESPWSPFSCQRGTAGVWGSERKGRCLDG